MTDPLRLFLRLAGALPLMVLHALAVLLAQLLWLTPIRLKRNTLRHLELCLPELDIGERRRIARQSLVHSAKAVLEAPAIWFGPRWRLQHWLHDEAMQARFRALIADRRGVILLCPHLGSWELAGLFCAANGAITTLYKPQKGAMDQLIHEGRSRNGAQLAPTSVAGVKALIRALREGEMVGILPDHDPPEGSGAFAPFFRLPAHTTTLVGKLASRGTAPVWFFYAERLDWARGFRFHLRPAPEGIHDAGERGLAALNLGVEQVIRHLPEQYWWSYKRYRRQPPGAPDFYRDL